jgi:hypothetical protein
MVQEHTRGIVIGRGGMVALTAAVLATVLLAIFGLRMAAAMPRWISEEEHFLQIWSIAPEESGTLFYTIPEEIGSQHLVLVAWADGDPTPPVMDSAHLREKIAIDVSGNALVFRPSEGSLWRWLQVANVTVAARGPTRITIDVAEGLSERPMQIGLLRSTADFKGKNISRDLDRLLFQLLFGGLLAAGIAGAAVLAVGWYRRQQK